MFSPNKYKNNNEPLLEPLFRWLRFRKAKKYLMSILNSDSQILDYGCGPESKFKKYLVENKLSFKKYCGYDQLGQSDNSCLNQTYDLLLLFAVLEHLDYPGFDYRGLVGLVKKGGYIIITTPTKMAKPILELLAFGLGLVSSREIAEHKHYFDLKELADIFEPLGMKTIEAKVFEFGLNNLVIFKKDI